MESLDGIVPEILLDFVETFGTDAVLDQVVHANVCVRTDLVLVLVLVLSDLRFL